MMRKHHCNKCNIDYWEDDENEPVCPMCMLKDSMKTFFLSFSHIREKAGDMQDLIEVLSPEVIE